MITPKCDRFQTEILEHFRNGQTALSAEAKAHFAACEVCIAAATKLLDQACEVLPAPITGAGAEYPAKDVSNVPAEAQQALTHGRQVLQREFGISVGAAVRREGS